MKLRREAVSAAIGRLRRRWAWLLLAALLLFPAARQAAVAYAPYEPTGDELYDSYARLLLDEMGRRNWNAAPYCWLTDNSYNLVTWKPVVLSKYIGLLLPKAPKTEQPVLLNCSAILDWEERFGADPRYLELRRFCKASDGTFDEAGFEADLQKLRGLCRAGNAPESSYATLFKFANRLVDPKSQELVEDVQLDVLDAAIRQFPDNSYWYYIQARVLLDLGEADSAWEAMQKGNLAPRNTWAQPFPYNTLFDPRYADSRKVGNRIVRGVIYVQYDFDLPNFIRIKESYKNACVMLALGYEPAFGDDMLKMAGRMGKMEQATGLYQTVAAVLASVLGEYVSTELLSEPLASDPQLLAIKSCSADFKRQAGDIAGAYPSLQQPVSRARTPFQAAQKRGTEIAQTTDADALFSTGAYRDMPALQKEDWLIFAEDFTHSRSRLEENAAFFDILADPPLARLFAAAEAADRAAAAQAQ